VLRAVFGSPLDPAPVYALMAFRDGLEHLQRAFAVELLTNPSADPLSIYELRADWLAAHARLAARGHDVSTIKLAPIDFERAHVDRELASAHAEVDRMLH
jgi:hypothetical protein